jgi:ketosteroid isomerase-like protein
MGYNRGMTELDRWVDGYVRAWNSNDPADIGALFTDDARYYTAPFREPWRGREQIVQGWLDRRDEPGDATFEWQPVLATGELAIVQGVTGYADETYSNLWVIRLDPSGRCHEFTEWWMTHST